jgi:TolB protein
MWFTNDAFHFAWTRIDGDFELSAAIRWLTEGGNAHRKACLMARESLEPDSAYVDLALHGDGLFSLQFRETAGGTTKEIQAGQGVFSRLGLRRQGEVFFAETSGASNSFGPCGAFTRLHLKGQLLVGLGVCAHDNKALEKAKFSMVGWSDARDLAARSLPLLSKPALHSALETISIASRDRRVVYHTTNLIEAPNWLQDGSNLVFNGSGRLYRIPAHGGIPQVIDTGSATRCNNDHGFSPDGERLAISDQSSGKSLIYILPAAGGVPAPITSKGPSYWHGWSPDGSTLAYCAERDGEFDVYSIRIGAGEETRLTTATGLDDGPEYSPDGKFIYFNSERTGSMQIWRMKPDGSAQEQVTHDEFNNWFPHPSPDGKWLAFLSYGKEVKGHPANQLVKLRMMPTGGGPIQELTHLFGGQGTINVPSWSPDSRQLAFVSYESLSD